MVSEKTLKTIEYDKIMASVADFATLDASKDYFKRFTPSTDVNEVKLLLKKTEEAYKLLYTYSANGVYYFDDVTDELFRADKGGVLSCGEILKVSFLLKSARIVKKSILTVSDEDITYIPEIASRLYEDAAFEKEIVEKIISPDELSDNASPRLYSIRKNIRNLNAKIREQLNSYMRGSLGKYVQENIVTVRQNRYVVPVKSEYRSFVKGFIHDQSSTGSTVFIEPEQIMELNNELKRATFEEGEEIYRILSELSLRISGISDALRYNADNLTELDCYFTRAIYSFKNKCTKPIVNDLGVIDLKKARHPLIAKDKVIPVSVKLGGEYNFLLITGPNTGGKTVTLKLTGLLTLMVMSGLYIPAEEESKVSVFNNVFCDIGDEQSIEQNLSTFSSHIKNLIEIINNIDNKSLVLLDEIGAGTDPEEGSALALAVIKKLLLSNCFGIITTHYSALKEYAMESGKIKNASMEFDAKTLKPLYRLNIGIPGSSNAIDIASALGLSQDVIDDAIKNLSNNKISFEKVLKQAEISRREAENLKAELENVKAQKEKELNEISLEKEKISEQRKKIYTNARQETKAIVADKLTEAEEIIDELKAILKKANLESKEVFKAGELRNRLKNSKYLTADDEVPFIMNKVSIPELSKGDSVYVKSLGAKAKILSINDRKGEAEVLIGDIKTNIKLNDIYNAERDIKQEKKVTVYKSSAVSPIQKPEVNVIGKTSLEALDIVRNFIDQAVVNNIEEIKIIHGVGSGVLLKSIRTYLKRDKNVAEFRRGAYGEGENGVTIIKLK